MRAVGTEITNYDPRTRPHWDAATKARQRVWMPPRTFFTSHKTGLTIAEPIYAGEVLVAVTTVDFDVTLRTNEALAQLASSARAVSSSRMTLRCFGMRPIRIARAPNETAPSGHAIHTDRSRAERNGAERALF